MLSPDEPETPSTLRSISKKWQYIMDKLSPLHMVRWGIFAFCFLLYALRVYYLNGWFIITYALGIYLLNKLLGFISPQVIIHFFNYYNICIITFSFIYSLTQRKLMVIWTSQNQIPKNLDLLLEDYQNLNFGIYVLKRLLLLSLQLFSKFLIFQSFGQFYYSISSSYFTLL